MAIGTNGNDTLSTTADLEFISGLDGNDSITSTHNFGFLVGGTGNDTLTTNLTSFAAQNAATQIGGGGNDSLSFNYTQSPTFASPTVVALLDGGNGNDTLTLVIPNTANRTTTSQGQAIGGYGADQIFAGVTADDENAPNAEMVVDAGIGHDQVLSAGTTAYNGGGSATTTANAQTFVDLGNGDDTLFGAGASTISQGTSTVAQQILGRAGNDDIRGFISASSWIFQSGGTATMTHEIDGGTGNDSIYANFRTSPDYVLGTVNGTSSLSGGNGADTLTSEVDITAANAIDFDETITTGAGGDSVTMDHDLKIAPATGLTLHNTTTNLGGSNDTLSATVDITDSYTGVSVNTVTASQGFNDITFTTNLTAFSFANINNSVTTGGNSDKITLVTTSAMAYDGTVGPSNYAEARNTIAANGGNDTIASTASIFSSGDALSAATPRGGLASNTITAGSGADRVTASTAIAAETAGTGTLRAEAFIDGGIGKDTLVSTIETPAFAPANIDMTLILNGGTANDVISSTIYLAATTNISGTSQIFGGSGSDNVSSNVTFTDTQSVTFSETISAGAGNDTLNASYATPTNDQPAITINGEEGADVIFVTIFDEGTLDIDGGTGNDRITVNSAVTQAGSHDIFGGDGDDTITGSNDYDDVAGGAGQDRIIASAGLDDYWGGAAFGSGDLEADTFVFDPAATTYTLDLNDFEAAFDILQFTGLADTGIPGLADDIDALGTFTDAGPGNTVTFALALGGTIDFESAGTGAVSSIADMVADPLTQLIA